VTSIDANPEFVSSAQESASALGIRHFEARVGDMRFLSGIAEGIFDVVVSCSVLEHLTAADQEVALTEIARVLKPGGLVGLTFDFGTAAPGSSKYLPPPHEPPPTAVEAVRRYSAAGLQLVGNDFSEDPVPGSLFHSETVSYTVASLFLTKGPRRAIARPRCERGEGLVTSLSIAGFPFRAYEYSRSLHSLQDESSLQLARRTLDRVRELELIAAERLDSIQEMHRHVDRLRQELAERQRGLETLAAAVAAKDERIASLETTAAERLDSVHQMHAHVDHLRSELARSAQEAGELRAVIEGRRAAIEDLEARLTQSCDRNTVLEQREAALQNKVVRLQNQTVWQVLTRRFKH
jgi:SAM-dependent methyltransferase